MQTSTLIRSLGQNDVRLVRRDQFLVGMALYPILAGFFARFAIPALSGLLLRELSFDLTPYYLLVVTYFIVLGTPLLEGMVVGFLLLDERDENTLTALMVTPVSLRRYLAYRAAVPMLLTFVMSVVGLVITSNLVALAFPHMLMVAASGSIIAALYALVMGAYAENKVQGFGIAKVANAFMVLPVAAYFLPEPGQYLVGIFPPYWSAKLLWSIVEGGGSPLVFFAISVAIQAVGLVLVLRHFDRVVYR